MKRKVLILLIILTSIISIGCNRNDSENNNPELNMKINNLEAEVAKLNDLVKEKDIRIQELEEEKIVWNTQKDHYIDNLQENLQWIEGIVFDGHEFPQLLEKNDEENMMLNDIKEYPIDIEDDEVVLSIGTSYKDDYGKYHIEYLIYKRVKLGERFSTGIMKNATAIVEKNKGKWQITELNRD